MDVYEIVVVESVEIGKDEVLESLLEASKLALEVIAVDVANVDSCEIFEDIVELVCTVLDELSATVAFVVVSAPRSAPVLEESSGGDSEDREDVSNATLEGLCEELKVVPVDGIKVVFAGLSEATVELVESKFESWLVDVIADVVDKAVVSGILFEDISVEGI